MNLGELAGWIWEASWQASLLVALVIAAQIGFRKWLNPAWRHALWGLVMARLLLPVLPESPFSVFNVLPQRVEVDLNESVEDPLLEPVSIEPITNAKVIPATEWVATDREGDTNPVTQPELRSVTPLPITVVKPISWPTILRNAWWIGFALASGLMVIAYISMRSRLARFRKIGDKRLLHLLAKAQSIIGIDRQIELLEADGPVGPALFGFFHTRLILPQGLADDFSDDELRNVFLHECGHLRRHDLALNWLVGLLRAAHWFNPVLWWAFGRMRTDRELACDDLVLRATGEAKARAYGDTIVRLLEHASKRPLLPGMVGIIESDSDIKQRINRIAGYRKATGWSVVATLLTITLAHVSLTNAVNRTPSREIPTTMLEQLLQSNRVLLATTWFQMTNSRSSASFNLKPTDSTVDIIQLRWRIKALSLRLASLKRQEAKRLMQEGKNEAARVKFAEAEELFSIKSFTNQIHSYALALSSSPKPHTSSATNDILTKRANDLSWQLSSNRTALIDARNDLRELKSKNTGKATVSLEIENAGNKVWELEDLVTFQARLLIIRDGLMSLERAREIGPDGPGSVEAGNDMRHARLQAWEIIFDTVTNRSHRGFLEQLTRRHPSGPELHLRTLAIYVATRLEKIEAGKIYLSRHPKMHGLNTTLHRLAEALPGSALKQWDHYLDDYQQCVEKHRWTEPMVKDAEFITLSLLCDGYLNYFKKLRDEANKSFQAAQTWDQDNRTASHYLSSSERRRQRALELATSAKKSFRKEAELHALLRLAKTSFDSAQYQQAESLLQKALKLDPKNEVAYYYLRLIREARYDQNARNRDPGNGDKGGAAVEKNDTIVGVKTNTLPPGNPYYLTNDSKPFLMHTSDGAKRIQRKLDEIVIPEVYYPGILLEDVMKDLIILAKRHDPEGQGLNFLIASKNNSVGRPRPNQAPVLDAMGNPIVAFGPRPFELGIENALIDIPQALKELKLRHVLNAIVKTSETPIRYVVEEYAIVFQPAWERPKLDLVPKVFKVDPEQLRKGLKGMYTSKFFPNAKTPPLDKMLREYFVAAGVNSINSTNESHRPRVFLNDTNGVIMARATLADLDIISQALELLNATPQKIRFEVAAAWINAATNKQEFGFKWFFGSQAKRIHANTQLTHDNDQSDLSKVPLAFRLSNVSDLAKTNQLDIQFGNLPIRQRGVLSDPQYRTIVHAIETRNGTVVGREQVSIPRGQGTRFWLSPKKGNSHTKTNEATLQEGMLIECRADATEVPGELRVDLRLYENQRLAADTQSSNRFQLRSAFGSARFPSGNVFTLNYTQGDISFALFLRAALVHEDGTLVRKEIEGEEDVWITSHFSDFVVIPPTDTSAESRK